MLLELGGFFTAALAVEAGRVVDGIGGSAGGLGYRALGTLDGEVAYAFGHVRKSTLFTGGAAVIAGDPDLPPDELAARAAHDPRARIAWDALIETAVEAGGGDARRGAGRPRGAGLGSRGPGAGGARGPRPGHRRGLAHASPRPASPPRVKEAAQGAALIADGLAGGSHRGVVETMRLRESRGSVLDHLYVAGADAVRRDFGLACGS